MSNHTLVPREWSVPSDALFPDEDYSPEELEWAAYCIDAKRVNIDDALMMVEERLSDVPELRTLVEEALSDPHRDPHAPRIPISQAIRLTNQVAQVVAQVARDLVTQRRMGG